MQLRIIRESGYLRAELQGRETAGEMREALWTILGECRRHAVPSLLLVTRASRPIFKVEEFGFSAFVEHEMGPACKVALLAENPELHAADEYMATMAQQKHANVRAFAAEAAAVRWLRGLSVAPQRRYRFNRVVIAGAPDEPGVYVLWQQDEVIYYGRAEGRGEGYATIRSRLIGHYAAGSPASHYSWEISREPAARESELLREFKETFGRLPRLNEAA